MNTTVTSVRNIGLVAHVDAGKTTTTEQILYQTGKIRSIGRVDDGTAHTDWLSVERERGISVRSATTVCTWRDTIINVIDTPGHVDFASEVERSLSVLDGAVLILSAVEGVQAQTEVLWRALQAMNIPTVFFINKMDRIGAEPFQVVQEMKRILSPHAVPIQGLIINPTSGNYEQVHSVFDPVDLIKENLLLYDQVVEEATLHDDTLLAAYLEGQSLQKSEVKASLMKSVQACNVFPIVFGSALQGVGIAPLLDTLVEFLPSAQGNPEASLDGVVFKIERDKTMGKMAYVRLYDGTLKNRDSVVNSSQGIVEKVTQIRKMNAQSHEDVGILKAGDIAAISGFTSARIGDVLGKAASVRKPYPLAVPLLTVQVFPEIPAQFPEVVAAFRELVQEDPSLDMNYYNEEQEIHIKVMGTIALEVLKSILATRFSLVVHFDRPTVIYKETPKKAGYGFVAYTMPKPCWAILRFLIEPRERGSGLVYTSQVRTEDLLQSYQNEVQRRVPDVLAQGLFGWEVTDLKITLVEGQHHVWHTHPLDFVVATPMGIMDGLRNTGTQLLEPILSFSLAVPQEYGGRILSDLVMMRAVFDPPKVMRERLYVKGEIPFATSMDYNVQLGALTGGRGSLTTQFLTYRNCPESFEVHRPRRGVDPLDTAKFILHARKAL